MPRWPLFYIAMVEVACGAFAARGEPLAIVAGFALIGCALYTFSVAVKGIRL